MKKAERKQLYKLLKQWTRAEIMARHGICKGMSFGDYFKISLEKVDKIRKLLYGSSDLIELGIKWGIMEPESNVEKRKKMRRK